MRSLWTGEIAFGLVTIPVKDPRLRVPYSALTAIRFGVAATTVATLSCTLGQAPVRVGAEPTVSAASPSSVTTANARSAKSRACFGGSQPETVAANEKRPTDLLTNGRELFWLSGFSIRRMDMATQKVSSIIATFKPMAGPDSVCNLVAVDPHDLFVLRGGPRGGALELAAIDLSTAQGRIVAHEPYIGTNTPSGEVASTPVDKAMAQMFANDMFSSSDYAVDKTYVYFAYYKPTLDYEYHAQHPEAMKGPHDLGFLSRVRRDGSGPVEELGAGPARFFIVSEGFAYWASPLEGIKRRELVPAAANEIVWAASDASYPSPMFVDSRRLFFATFKKGLPRSFAIASVPAGTIHASAEDAGGVDVRTHVASCQNRFGSSRPLFDGRCVYFGSYLGVSRVDIDDAGEQDLVSGPSKEVPANARTFVATDGQYLYWADYSRDRIVRWAR